MNYLPMLGMGAFPNFKPTDVAGCRLWLRGDLGVTGTTTVTRWADQSGNANDATTGVGTVSLNASSIGGKPGLTFSSSGLLGAANPVASGSPRTVFSVVKSSNNTGGTILDFRQSPFALQIAWQDLGNNYVFGNASGDVYYAPGVDTAGHILEHSYDGGTAWTGFSFAIDSVTKTLTLPGGSATPESGTTGYDIGIRTAYSGIQPWPGDICEILIYDTIITGANLTKIRNYLKNRYGL